MTNTPPVRKLKSYDDIAEYIVEQIQFRAVSELPQNVWDVLSPSGSTLTNLHPYLHLITPSAHIELRIIQSPNSIVIQWTLNGEKVFEHLFTRPTITEKKIS